MVLLDVEGVLDPGLPGSLEGGHSCLPCQVTLYAALLYSWRGAQSFHCAATTIAQSHLEM